MILVQICVGVFIIGLVYAAVTESLRTPKSEIEKVERSLRNAPSFTKR